MTTLLAAAIILAPPVLMLVLGMASEKRGRPAAEGFLLAVVLSIWMAVAIIAVRLINIGVD